VGKAVVVGIGNIMFSDDGLGVYAAKYLESNFIKPPNVDIIDGGTLGFKLMTYYQEYDYVCILSTTSEGTKPGEIFHFSVDELLNHGACRQSANEVEVVQMLEICSILDEEMAEVDIIAMKPEDIMPVEANLTPTVQDAIVKMVEKAIDVMRKRGIQLQPKAEHTPLCDIIHFYANPTQEIYNPKG
jgi:hydrogenase maturation protease